MIKFITTDYYKIDEVLASNNIHPTNVVNIETLDNENGTVRIWHRS